MATKKITLEGNLSWAKVFEDNRDMKGFEGAYEEHDGGYTVVVTLDHSGLNDLKASGSMKKGTMSEGGVDVKFLRKHTDRFDWASGAPKVYKPDGTVWDFAADGHIPNGSEGKVVLSVYDTSRKSIKGTRLEEVYVTKVAEMDGAKNDAPDW